MSLPRRSFLTAAAAYGFIALTPPAASARHRPGREKKRSRVTYRPVYPLTY